MGHVVGNQDLGAAGLEGEGFPQAAEAGGSEKAGIVVRAPRGPSPGGVLSPASMAVRRYGKRPCADFPRFRLRKR